MVSPLRGDLASASCSELEIEDVAQKLKVCGHPIRLRLLCLISRGEDACVSELWECLNQPQPVISQHLAVLKEKGIVDAQVQGNKRIYSIVDPFIGVLVQGIQSSSSDFEPSSDASEDQKD